MSGTGRRRTTAQARAEAAAASAAAEPELVAAVPPAVEVLEDRTLPIAGGHGRRSLGRSVPGAIVGTLLVVGLAFGAALGPGGALGPAGHRGGGDIAAPGGETDGAGDGEGSMGGSQDGDSDQGRDGDDDAAAGPDETDGTGAEHPDATENPNVSGGTDPTDKPDATPKPAEKPAATPKPAPDQLVLGVVIKELHPFLEWGSCAGLDFDYYKVVRSTNSTVSWPTGDGDQLIAVVEPGGTRKAYDKDAPHGVKVWYRVFCVRHTEDGYKVLISSATKGIEVPEEPAPPPPPDPISLGLEAGLTDGGKVLLDWSACSVDGFAFYKVVGSTTTNDPSYLPYHDGTQVLGVVSDAGSTQLEVWAPDAGHTAWFRVQCIGYWGDQKVLLGESAVVSVSVP